MQLVYSTAPADWAKKKIFCVQPSVKKVMLTIFGNMKRSIIIDFLEKHAIVNSASYCKILVQNSHYLLSFIYEGEYQAEWNVNKKFFIQNNNYVKNKDVTYLVFGAENNIYPIPTK